MLAPWTTRGFHYDTARSQNTFRQFMGCSLDLRGRFLVSRHCHSQRDFREHHQRPRQERAGDSIFHRLARGSADSNLANTRGGIYQRLSEDVADYCSHHTVALHPLFQRQFVSNTTTAETVGSAAEMK